MDNWGVYPVENPYFMKPTTDNIDDYTMTSQGWVWSYPNKPSAGHNCIATLPPVHLDVSEYAGVCSDYIGQYK